MRSDPGPAFVALRAAALGIDNVSRQALRGWIFNGIDFRGQEVPDNPQPTEAATIVIAAGANFRSVCFDNRVTGKGQRETEINSWPGVLRSVRNGSVMVAAAATVVSNTIGEPAETHIPVHLMGQPVHAHPPHGPESPSRPLSWERVEVQMISAGPPIVEWRLVQRS